MKILDLGVLEGEVLLFGGPCSNVQATSALFDEAARRGIDPANCICTGDMVAYCADPAATVDLIMASGCTVVAGNMELALAGGATQCGCGFDSGTACDLASGAWFAHGSRAVTPEARAFMASCPDAAVFEHSGRKIGVLHGGLTDVARFLWPTGAIDTFAQEWSLLEEKSGRLDMIVAGHCGLPFSRSLPQGMWVNAGAIGMPPNDGDVRTCFATLDAEGAHLHRLSYDHRAASQHMVDAGLIQGYERTLCTGFWPSEDVLPAELRKASMPAGPDVKVSAG